MSAGQQVEYETVWHGGMRPRPMQVDPVVQRERPSDPPTPVQDAILALFEAHGPLTRRQVMALSGRSLGSVSTTVDRMIGRGIITESHKVKVPGQVKCWAYKVLPCA